MRVAPGKSRPNWRFHAELVEKVVCAGSTRVDAVHISCVGHRENSAIVSSASFEIAVPAAFDAEDLAYQLADTINGTGSQAMREASALLIPSLARRRRHLWTVAAVAAGAGLAAAFVFQWPARLWHAVPAPPSLGAAVFLMLAPPPASYAAAIAGPAVDGVKADETAGRPSEGQRTTSWTNPLTGEEGTITDLGTVEGLPGEACWRFRIVIESVAGEASVQEMSVCRRRDGSTYSFDEMGP
ncbi:MAG: hypothetical protein IBJ15_00190 [Alphaproteobacteria bacterium]|nr:hypothetical protein [Alphaproteobacteria bacterium]